MQLFIVLVQLVGCVFIQIKIKYISRFYNRYSLNSSASCIHLSEKKKENLFDYHKLHHKRKKETNLEKGNKTIKVKKKSNVQFKRHK